MKIIILSFLMFISSRVFAGQTYKLVWFEEPISGYKKICKISGYKIFQDGEKIQSSILPVQFEITAKLSSYAAETKVELTAPGEHCSKLVIESPNRVQKIFLKSSEPGFIFRMTTLPQ